MSAPIGETARRFSIMPSAPGHKRPGTFSREMAKLFRAQRDYWTAKAEQDRADGFSDAVSLEYADRRDTEMVQSLRLARQETNQHHRRRSSWGVRS